jgi:hypothetical protein
MILSGALVAAGAPFFTAGVDSDLALGGRPSVWADNLFAAGKKIAAAKNKRIKRCVMSD